MGEDLQEMYFRNSRKKAAFMIAYQDSTKQVFKMSVPIFVELLLQLLVGNVDQFMVSHYSQNSVAAIGNANQVMNIVIIVLNVMSVATTILLSQYLGADNRRKIGEVCNISVLIIAVTSLVTTAAIVILHRQIFVWMQIPEEIIGEASSYLLIVGSCILIQGLYMTFAAILRSFAMLGHVMMVSLIMNLLNIVGNAILINGLLGAPRLGIVGAAISTDVSKFIGLVIVFFLFLKKTGIGISPVYFRPFPKDTAKKLLFIGLPSCGEELSYNLSQIVILGLINIFGTTVIATKVYCSMLANVAYVYTTAIAQATQIALGYLIGAGQLDRVSYRVKRTLGISILVSLSLILVIFLGSDWIFSLFTDDPAVHALGRKIILVEFLLELGRAVNIVMSRCLVAAGDVKVPVAVGVVFMWSVAVALGYLFGIVLGYGLVGIWIAMALDECVRAVVFLIRFRTGKWREKLMVNAPADLPKPAGEPVL